MLFVCRWSPGHSAGAAVWCGGVVGAAGERSRDQRLPQRPETGGGVRGQGQSSGPTVQRADMWPGKWIKEGKASRHKFKSCIHKNLSDSKVKREKQNTLIWHQCEKCSLNMTQSVKVGVKNMEIMAENGQEWRVERNNDLLGTSGKQREEKCHFLTDAEW